MIQDLQIKSIPCFPDDQQPISPLSQLTFIYGPNGSGKSSIAKKIGDCETGQVRLYNRSYASSLLNPESEIPGVFRVRDGDDETQSRIEELVGPRGEISLKASSYETKLTTLRNKEEEIEEEKGKLQEIAWNTRKKLPEDLQWAFRGFNSKKKVVDEVLAIKEGRDAGNAEPLEALMDAAIKLETGDLEIKDLIRKAPAGPKYSDSDVSLIENPVKLGSDSSFRAIMERIGSQDWVNQGREFLPNVEDCCPFCQQKVDDQLISTIEGIFEGQYEEAKSRMEALQKREEVYKRELEDYLDYISQVQVEGYEVHLENVRSLSRSCNERISRLNDKFSSMSSSMSFDIDVDSIERVDRSLEKLNDAIESDNKLARDVGKARMNLKDKIWEHLVLVELRDSLQAYFGAVQAPKRAVESLAPKVEKDSEDLEKLKNELRCLQLNLRTSEPTMESINDTLKSLGFNNFSIKNAEGADQYILVRPDGTLVERDLSEGEETLISFLYFYHSVVQQSDDSSLGSPFSIVIDDPISSLDSETLFVINLLLRRLLDICVEGSGALEQVILLTHNAYFFKEASFAPRGMKEGVRSYFILRKRADGKSIYDHFDCNPVQSNYALLWAEIRAAKEKGGECAVSVPNAMRRVIENYFKVAGNISEEDIIANIPEDQAWNCRSLLSWVNDGSHSIVSEIDFSSLAADIETHLRAFRTIFDAAGHSAHYNMMMAGS